MQKHFPMGMSVENTRPPTCMQESRYYSESFMLSQFSVNPISFDCFIFFWKHYCGKWLLCYQIFTHFYTCYQRIAQHNLSTFEAQRQEKRKPLVWLSGKISTDSLNVFKLRSLPLCAFCPFDYTAEHWAWRSCNIHCLSCEGQLNVSLISCV